MKKSIANIIRSIASELDPVLLEPAQLCEVAFEGVTKEDLEKFKAEFADTLDARMSKAWVRYMKGA